MRNKIISYKSGKILIKENIFCNYFIYEKNRHMCARLNYGDPLWGKNKVNDDNLNNSRKRAEADDKYHVYQWYLMIKWLSIDVHSLVQYSRLFISV